MITREHERELIRRFQEEGDEGARAALVEAHYRWIINAANRYKHRCIYIDTDDLIQVGAIHLLEAIPKFDLSRGTRLLTFCTLGIRSAMKNALVEQGPIRVPVNAFDSANSEECRALAERAKAAKSLDAPTRATDGDKDRASLVPGTEPPPDQIAAETEIARAQLAALHSAMTVLSRNERSVLEGLRNGRSDVEMADAAGVCRERVRQVKERAISKLRAAIAAKSTRPKDWHQRMRERHAKAKV